MLPVIHIGPLAIQTPGLILLLGIGIGLSFAEKHATRHQINGNLLDNMVILGLAVGVIGARLAYVLQYPAAFIANPPSLVSLNFGLFNPLWGTILGLCTIYTYAWRKKLPFWQTLDSLTIAFGIFSVAYHLANFASGDAYGSPSNLPWAIQLWGERRHPVQIYEALAAILIIIVIWYLQDRNKIAGQNILFFIAMSSGAKIFLEAFHGDSVFWAGYRIAQVIAWLILAFSLWGMHKIKEAK